jgi:hypothetical protein
MHKDTKSIVDAHWACANARDWDGFAALLSPKLHYEVPQTREYIESGEGYLELFSTWPGNWSAVIKQLVCEGQKAICVVDFVVESETLTGISVFEVSDGLIVSVTDYWPEPYEPPARKTLHIKRHAAVNAA